MTFHLSSREVQIVRLAAQGNPNKVIAHELNISAWTVNTHLRRIFAKLGVCSKAAMVARFMEAENSDAARSFAALAGSSS